MDLNFNQKINLRNFFLITIFSTILFSCAGGGGGGGGGGSSADTSGTCKNGSSSSFCTTEFHANYGLKNIKAYEAYEDGYTGSGVKVAVLDGGFDTSHTDLDANFITGYDEEDDNNTPNADSHNSTMGGHGTHVAGIIAAEKNGVGMHGVAYEASIIPIKVFKDDGSFVSGGIQNSINYGTDNGGIALNNSWGSYRTVSGTCSGVSCYIKVPAESSTGGFSSDERTAWANMVGDNNVAVFAAGNDGNNSATGMITRYRSSDNAALYQLSANQTVNNGWITYSNRSSQEAQYAANVSAVAENWINVVAVDSNNTIASYSNGCGNTKAYCIAAPGSAVYSTVPTDLNSSGYDTYNGTSMAAPHVSGALALLKQKWPNLTGAQLVDLLLNNATDLGDSGTDDVYGVGLLNLDASFTASGSLKISYIDQHGNLQKFDLENSSINSNKLLKNLKIDLPIGVVDEYNRVYSVRLNDLSYSKISDNNYISERYLLNNNQYIPVNNELFYINNENYNINKFSAKDRQYDYDFISYERYIFDNQQNFHIPIGQTVTLTTDTEEFKNLIFKSSYDLDINDYKLNIETGLISERDSLLGTTFSGAFEIREAQTYFAKFKNSYDLNGDKLKFNIGYGLTKSDFKDSNVIEMSDIHTFESTLAYEKKLYQSKFTTALELPLHIAQGEARFTNLSGYDIDGNYKNTSQMVNLSSDKIDGKISFYYDINIDETSDFGTKYSINNDNYSEVQIVYSKKF